MKWSDYVPSALRTANLEGDQVENFTLGLIGEIGELPEMLKKARFHGAELDRERLQG